MRERNPGANTPCGAKPKILIIGPVPPPAFGVAKATHLMLESTVLSERFDLTHLDTSDITGFTGIGRLTWGNVRLGIRHVTQLGRLLRRHRPDAVLLTASQGLMGLVRDGLFVSLSRTFRVPTVTYLRGSRYAEMRQRQGVGAALVLRSILKHTSRVLVLGESLVEMAMSVWPDAHVAVVPNGCPPAVPEAMIGTRDDHPLVIYVGRLSREKGLEDALLAAREVVASVSTARFVFCGEWDSPEFRRTVEPLVERYGLAEAVEFPGPVSADERAALLSQAWVLLMPSHSEGQPWVILEAMSAGVPVVATDTGAIAETVGNGIGGVVTSVGDSPGLAQGIATLLHDDALWKQMSKGAISRYRERFTLERSHTLLAEQLDQVTRPTEDRTTSWFSHNASRFDRQYGKSALFADRYELWERLIKASCGPESRVLDIGCGSGVFSAVAARQGATVVAADPSQKMLDLCESRCASLRLSSCTVLKKSLEELEDADLEPFDLVLASSVLEYVEELASSLATLGRASRAGATLIASIPNSLSFRRRAEKITFRLLTRPKYYRLVKNAPSLSEFKELLHATGFAVCEIHYYGLNRLLRPWSRRDWVRARFGTMIAVVATKS